MDFVLNGAPACVQVRGGEHLLEVLREQCGVTSVKDGCAPEGSCGACTVLVDGKAVVSCAQQAARFAGREIITQEGLTDAERELWAKSFVAAGASQCGFCSPGMILSAKALLDENPRPSEEEIRTALSGVLCRCGSYRKIVSAVKAAASAMGGNGRKE